MLDRTEFPLVPILPNEEGKYVPPTTRFGILPYYRQNDQIFWGVVRSNRLGFEAIGVPAGIQDVLVFKGELSFALEVGKPFPNLNIIELDDFVGILFREDIYHQIISILEANQFSVFLEHPMVTAMYEAQEEHGIDLRKQGGRDVHLLNFLHALPEQALSGRQGAHAQCLWVASLKNADGVALNRTDKIDQKIRRNLGRRFYEAGCWETLETIQNNLISIQNDISEHDQSSLIAGAISTYEETLKLLIGLEQQIRKDLNMQQLPLFNPHIIKDIFSLKAVLRNKHISYNTWLILDLDNTVMESISELGSDQWFTAMRDQACLVLQDTSTAAQLSLSIYLAVQKFIHTKPVEENVVKIIQTLQAIGLPIIALTARSESIIEDTIRQLQAIEIDFSKTAPAIDSGQFPYHKGIIFCSGRDKGKAWQSIMAQSSNYPKHIVMLDDHARHLERMSQALQEKSPKTAFTGLKYRFLDSKVSLFNMKKADVQLAMLREKLPEDVQENINQIGLCQVI